MKLSHRKKILAAKFENKPESVHLVAADGASKASQARTREEIEREAYATWERNGRQHGSDQDHWFEAEKKKHGQGNPAYPSLDEREEIVKAATGEPANVRKIPADDM